ncbi:unnamed protein product [Rotaria magnacalcarata]|uniref:A-kinase anchor protein 14 n=1 Tax=Rotaria magnacalcarata TaxID=392030 RepID=A0A818YNG9_9BILA|nr:unnamed protein product [Rotaria magnacalcarata]CAF3758002.1 unnamed protein product [Rotaria magnacalcarata]CAF3934255.1 unnamed protein product [Rotaria magnacalcarata]CAF3963595.1 unnamed protein product [Rotaria magnacalcarata]
MAVTNLHLPVAHQSEEYDIFAHEAHRIIDQLVNQSLTHVNDTNETSDPNNEEYNIQRGRFIVLENETKTQGQTSIRWPTIVEFTDEKVGIEKINEYIEKVILLNLISKKIGSLNITKIGVDLNIYFSSHQIDSLMQYKEWKTAPGGHDDSWLYAIDFLERKSLEFNYLYIYRVRYSIPTRRQPIPRQTVSVYFTIDVSKIKPKNTIVHVSFVFETMRVVYHPGEFRFRQNWLEDIILFKEKMANDINF